METIEKKIARVVNEDVKIMPYDPRWLDIFEQERDHLQYSLPSNLVKRIEHIGSTAVPGLPAKPIVDILIEVTSLEKNQAADRTNSSSTGYDYFWRPSFGDDTPPFYAWFIKRNNDGQRTHHIHMIEHLEVARDYANLKKKLADSQISNCVSYTEAKSSYIISVTNKAKDYYK